MFRVWLSQGRFFRIYKGFLFFKFFQEKPDFGSFLRISQVLHILIKNFYKNILKGSYLKNLFTKKNILNAYEQYFSSASRKIHTFLNADFTRIEWTGFVSWFINSRASYQISLEHMKGKTWLSLEHLGIVGIQSVIQSYLLLISISSV